MKAMQVLGTVLSGMLLAPQGIVVAADGVDHLDTTQADAITQNDEISRTGKILPDRNEECDPTWLPTSASVNSHIFAMATFDDGSGTGPALFVGGNFTSITGVPVNKIAKWDGSSWSALGNGVNGVVRTLVVHDDGMGGGPALYVGGSFSMAGDVVTNNIAKWDGQEWSPVGEGTSGTFPAVSILEVFDDGSGPALYAGGPFSTMDGILVNGIAKWDGSEWSAVGGGMGGMFPYVRSLGVFDDGNGPALYAGGQFTMAGGVPAIRIARWDGMSWSAVGSGMNNTVRVLKAFDDGQGDGPALYAGGAFTTAGDKGANRVAKWNGHTWSPLGSGMSSPTPVTTVYEFEIYDDGTRHGPALYVAGQFLNAGGVEVNHIAQWDGTSWSALGEGLQWRSFSLQVFDDGSGDGPLLYVGGQFSNSPAGDAYLAKWGGCAAAPQDIVVHFDIRPGSCPNPLNTNAQGVLPAAILGDSDFDVTHVNPATITLNRADGVGGVVAPLNGPPGPGIKIEDVGTPFTGDASCKCHAEGPDGIDDLTLKFNIPQLVAALELDDVSDAMIELRIEGELHDGTPFSGTDCILFVGMQGIIDLLNAMNGYNHSENRRWDLNADGVVDAEDLLILIGLSR